MRAEQCDDGQDVKCSEVADLSDDVVCGYGPS